MQILHVDSHLLVVAKPAGIPVIPARTGDPNDCVHKRLEAERGERLWVVHRIDRDTSGVLIFARTAEAHRALSIAFEEREVQKSYRAITLGRPPANLGTIDVALHEARKGRMRPAREGEEGALESVTDYRVLATRVTDHGQLAIVEALPHTGRQHQIRVHLKSVGAPLLVDPIYGPYERLDADAFGLDFPEVPRLTLHAHRIVFMHPALKVRVALEAPLPPDLDALATWIEGH